MGFKQALAKADKDIKQVLSPLAKKAPKYKSTKPENDKEDADKAYGQGKSDMEQLLTMFSNTFCRQFAFVMGFGRKTKGQSEAKLFAYCEGFMDALEGK